MVDEIKEEVVEEKEEKKSIFAKAKDAILPDPEAVSYTHLTLPTIYSV